jgi:hypothetical protein
MHNGFSHATMLYALRNSSYDLSILVANCVKYVAAIWHWRKEMDVLLTWIGSRDPLWKNPRTGSNEPGPVLSLLARRRFDIVYLLFNLHSHAVGLQLREPAPAVAPDRLQVLQAGVPAVEHDALRGEAACPRRRQHRAEVVVLAQPIARLVVEPVVAGDQRRTVGPQQGQEIDALHDPPVLARPLPCEQADLARVGLVQRAVVADQDACLAPDLRHRFRPQSRRIGFQAVQQAGEGVVRRRVGLRGLHAGGCRAAHRAWAGHQEVDVVDGVAFRGVHAPSLADHRQLRKS